MAISLVTYTNQSVSAQDDALIYQTAVKQSGIIYGCEVTIKNATTLHIASGHGVICGRKFTVTAQDFSITLSGSGTIRGRLYIHMDLSNASTPIAFMTQVAASLTNPVQQADCNITSGIYEINLATFNVSTSTISNLVDVAPEASSTIKTKTVTSKVLTAGSETIYFDVPITGDHLIDFYTSTGVAYTQIDTSVSGKVTLTFDPQATNVTVYCTIEEV